MRRDKAERERCAGTGRCPAARRMVVLLVLHLAAVPGLAVPAGAAGQGGFAAWLEGLKAEALARGVRAPTLERALAGLSPIPRVIELDRRQPERVWTFEEYLSRVVTAQRVARGRRMLARYRGLLSEIETRYGVPARYIVALWGIETDYGRLRGGFPVIGALATLAYDGRRSGYFRGELLDALRILDQGHIALSRMTGSWAGAMGQNQFMPSSFLRYAVDHDGDGRRDIWTDEADVLASAANYLARAGWRRGERWGREVKLSRPIAAALTGPEIERPLSAWRSLGVRRADGGPLPVAAISASLIRPDDESARTFLVYPNFRVLLKWNRSVYFGLAVGRLADRIAAR